MNKSILIFIILSLIIVLASFGYVQYCKSQNPKCEQETMDMEDFGPKEGVDW